MNTICTINTIEHLTYELKQTLIQHKKTPYLPAWGEIFTILKKIEAISIKFKINIQLYPVQPTGELYFDFQRQKFVVSIPDITINISDNQLTDSLLSGRFMPKE